MLAAARAEFLQAQAILDVLLILGRLIVALFAIAAREHQNTLILGRHNLLRNLDNLNSLKPPARIELATAALPMRSSTDELQGPLTLRIADLICKNPQSATDAGGRIRTAVLVRDQIYSLTPLTTRPPLRDSL